MLRGMDVVKTLLGIWPSSHICIRYPSINPSINTHAHTCLKIALSRTNGCLQDGDRWHCANHDNQERISDGA
eukprot:11177442-Lingulodinium_polyedra.AAC.1